MKDIKYSIITANYNGFKLMKKYFESLENQSYKKFEIIIIDDCSTDDSYKQIKDYSKKSKLNIKLEKTSTNSGPGAARNIGIKIAKGDYITFIDNDDWVEPSLFMKVNNILRHNKYDCLIYDYYMDFGKKMNTSSSLYGDFEGEISKSSVLRYIRNHSVCKFYKTSVINISRIEYPNIRRHEDIAFVGTAVAKCDTFYYLKEPLYHYVQHNNSLSRNNEINIDTIKSANEIVKLSYGEKYQDELMEKSVLDLLYNSILLMCKNRYNRKDIVAFIDSYSARNKKWYKYNINKYAGIKKKIFLKCVRYKLIVCLKIYSFAHNMLGG